MLSLRKKCTTKLTVFALILIILMQYGNLIVFAQEPTHNPIWETNDLDKIYYYMAAPYDKDTQSWKLDEDFNSADESIAQEIMAFTNEIQSIQEGPIGETSFSRILETAELVASLTSGNFGTIIAQLVISNLPQEIREDAKILFRELADVTSWVYIALREAGTYQDAKIIIDAKNIDFKALGAIGFLAETVVNLVDFIDIYNRHCWIMEQVEALLIEGTDLVKNIKNAIVSYELTAEEKGIVYDIFKWALIIGGKTLGAALLAKLFAIIGTAVGDGIGTIAGALVGSFLGSLAGEQVAIWLAEAFHRLGIEKGWLLERVVDKFWRFYRDTHIGAEIIDIWTWTLSGRGDNRMLKFVPGDIVYVKIRNTGEYRETFVISPFVEDGQWTILHSNWIGNLLDLVDFLLGDFERITETVTLEPGQETIISFIAIPYGWPLSEEFPYLPTFYPQAKFGFSLWYEKDDVIRHMDTYKETMYSQDENPGATFEVICEAEMLYYGRDEEVSMDVRIQNTGTKTAYDLFSYVYVRYFGQNPILLTIHSRPQLDGEGSREEWWTFSHDWTVPLDGGVGQALIDVKIFGADVSGGVQKEYGKVAIQGEIFDVYGLNIITPTSSGAAIAGDPADPISIFATVTGLPSLIRLNERPTFSVTIGTKAAAYEQVDSHSIPIGIYVLKIQPPLQIAEGKYDLEITVTFDSTIDSDTEFQSVEYTTASSPEPIDKGLAWLRTRQYGDGSWYHSVGITSLTALAFLNSGYDETDLSVKSAIEYILSYVQADGSIGSDFYRTYETSIAILPLVATHNDAYSITIENAKNWLVASQWDEDCIWWNVNKDNWYYGGFGYGSHSRPDLSNTQWALMGLDAAGLPRDDPTWKKAQIFLARSQNRHTTVTIDFDDGPSYTVQPYSWQSNDGGFIYYPGASLAGGTTSYGSMTAAGIWSLLLCGVDVNDARLTGDGVIKGGLDWIVDHYTWDLNPGMPEGRKFQYYYYVTLSKALTMARMIEVNGDDWYQTLSNKLVDNLQQPDGRWVNSYTGHGSENIAELATAYSILALQTRAGAPLIERLSYLTFVLRSNCFLRILDSEGNLVGYNYMTGLGENNVPAAVYSGPFSEPQYVVIVTPEAGTYDLELIGTSEGPYELTIQGNYGEAVTDLFEYAGEIGPAELHGTDVTVTAIVGPVDVYAEPPEFEEIIDNTPPSITVVTPKEDPPEALQDGVTLETLATDPSGVDWVTFSIREPDGTIIDPMFESMAATDVGSDLWQAWIDTNVPELPDGYYLLLVNASDMLGNEGSKTVQFSIRNWACLELLPSTKANKAGRTMPVKFSLRVAAAVDPAQPFVYNEELTIEISKNGDTQQTSTYGTTARDYRINSENELYITNFRTARRKLATYVVDIYRKDMLIGSFDFSTVK